MSKVEDDDESKYFGDDDSQLTAKLQELGYMFYKWHFSEKGSAKRHKNFCYGNKI